MQTRFAANTRPLLPLWLKLGYTAWMVIWIAAYLWLYSPANFFWLCNVANLLILVALWRESAVLVSAQALAVVLVGIIWTMDVAVAFSTGGADGQHLIGGTEYMFDPEIPLAGRMLSFYHTVTPLIVVGAIIRLGYDRRGLWLQTAIGCLVILVTRLLTSEESNINWVYGPFGQPQTLFPVWLYLPGLMIAAFMFIYLPTHLLLRIFSPQSYATEGNRASQ